MYTIYKATHIPTGKIYVGYTGKSLQMRIGQHWGAIESHRKAFQIFLHTTLMEEWKWEQLKTVETYKEARECEMYYIHQLECYKYGLNSKTGTIDTEKRSQASARLKAYKQLNPEPWNKGKKGCFSEETLNLMRLAKLKKPSIPVYTEEDKIRKSLQATNSKKIKELKTGLEFNSISMAARHFKLRREAVRDVVNGKRTHTSGYVFVNTSETMEQK